MMIKAYPLRVTEEQTVEMPKRARVISIQVINNKPILYAEIDTEDTITPRTIFMRQEDAELEWHTPNNPAVVIFIGTFQVVRVNRMREESIYVWHCYEKAW